MWRRRSWFSLKGKGGFQGQGRDKLLTSAYLTVPQASSMQHAGTPKPVLHAGDRQHDLIQVPLVSGGGQPAPDLVGKRLPELQRPLAHGFMADGDASRARRDEAASSLSTMRKLSGKRKHSQTAWLMISTGKR